MTNTNTNTKQHRLTETRKADREAMAKEVIDLAARMAWGCIRLDYGEPDMVRLHLTGPRGLSCSIEFERRSGMKDAYCMPWHFESTLFSRDRQTKLSDQFGRFQGSAVNSIHRRKCTAFAYGIDMLLDKLEVAMKMANGTSDYGSAFESEAANG